MFYIIKSNKVFIYRILLFIVLGIFISIFIYYTVLVYMNMYDEYIATLSCNKANHTKYILEHRFLPNQENNTTRFIWNKNNHLNIIDFKELKYQDGLNNKWTFVKNTNNEISIYKAIIQEISLDFNTKGTETYSNLNSTYSSPIIERVNINSIFSKAIASANTINDTTNHLGIQGINNSSSNRSSVIVENVILNKLKTTELLNYQSNILYCLINGLSPSLY